MHETMEAHPGLRAPVLPTPWEFRDPLPSCAANSACMPQAHPTPDLKLPEGPDSPNYWMYQNTWVDVNSLRPTLDKAMQLVKAQPQAQ